MQNIFIDILPPWVETGLQPAFYDLESGTVLQQTARMYAKVRELTTAFNQFSEDVSNEINSFEQKTNDEIERFEGVVNDTVEEYIEKFNELHDYVHDYFDNLDVQEEINNKLDKMLEDGVLQEIITTYIQSNVAWTFDTVSDMAQATNLIDGSFARTLGYHAINDGGGALYKIVDTQPATGHYETLSGSLYASLVYDGSIKPCQYGAYHDGTHDDSDVLQECLDDLHDHIYFVMDLQGYKYWIAKPLHLDSTYRATIKNGEINALNTFQIDGEDTEKNYLLYTTNVNNNPSGEVYGGVATEDLKITNITFDCKYIAGLGCLRLRYYLRVNVDLCLFRRYLTEGVKTTNDGSHELVLTNSNFNASLGPNESNSTGVAIVCNGFDNIYSNIIITGGKYGIQLDQAKANMFSKVHIYGQTDYSIYSVSASQNTYEEMYIDGKGIYIYNPWLVTFVNCYFLVNVSPITLDKTGSASTFGVKFIGCIGTNYGENDVDLITLPNGNFTHCTDCTFDLAFTTHIVDNRYLVDVPYTTKFNKVFINDANADYAMNTGGQIIATTASKYTFTAVNNIIDVTAFDSSGDNWLAFVVPLENNKTYKCINKDNNTANFRVFGISSLDLWTLGTKIKEATPTQYGYDTFNSGSYSFYLVAVYGVHRFNIEISEA